MPPISGSWEKALKGEFSKEYYKKLFIKSGRVSDKDDLSSCGRYIQCLSFYTSGGSEGGDSRPGSLP